MPVPETDSLSGLFLLLLWQHGKHQLQLYWLRTRGLTEQARSLKRQLQLQGQQHKLRHAMTVLIRGSWEHPLQEQVVVAVELELG